MIHPMMIIEEDAPIITIVKTLKLVCGCYVCVMITQTSSIC